MGQLLFLFSQKITAKLALFVKVKQTTNVHQYGDK